MDHASFVWTVFVIGNRKSKISAIGYWLSKSISVSSWRHSTAGVWRLMQLPCTKILSDHLHQGNDYESKVSKSGSFSVRFEVFTEVTMKNAVAVAACRRSLCQLLRVYGVACSVQRMPTAGQSRLPRLKSLLFHWSSSSFILRRLSRFRSKPNATQRSTEMSGSSARNSDHWTTEMIGIVRSRTKFKEFIFFAGSRTPTVQSVSRHYIDWAVEVLNLLNSRHVPKPNIFIRCVLPVNVLVLNLIK
jgi:hypothetical protein